MTSTRVQTRTITGTDVRKVADSMWQSAQAVYKRYSRMLPYDLPKLRQDLGQILLWDMADKVSIQFYDSGMNEKLSYEFVPEVDENSKDSSPDEFPVYEAEPGWQVRLVVRQTGRKPAEEVVQFFQHLGWIGAPELRRSATGATEKYGSFRSGDFTAGRYVYREVPASNEQKGQMSKEVQP